MIHKQTHSGLFYLLIFLAASLRLIGLDKGFSSDELWLVNIAQLPLKNLYPSLIQGTSTFPPFGIFLVHFWTKVSTAEWWIRLYFVWFGLGLCYVIFHLTKKIFNKWQISYFVLFLTSISPLLIWTSQFTRSYIDFAFWMTLSLYFHYQFLHNPQKQSIQFGYIFTTLCSLYTSYMTVIILLSKNLYMIIPLLKRQMPLIKKWLGLQFILFVLFLPGLSLLLKQKGLGTVEQTDLHKVGFIILNLNIGRHIRSFFAIIGFDPDFLDTQSITQLLPFPALILIAFTGAVLFIFIISKGLQSFLSNQKKNTEIHYFPFILISSLLIYNIVFVELLNRAVQPEYFIVQHVLFLVIIGALIGNIKKIISVKGIVILSLCGIYLLRYPTALSPQFDTKKSNQYLLENYQAREALLIIRKTNRYIKSKNYNLFDLSHYMKYKIKQNEPNHLNKNALDALEKLKQEYSAIWFYKIAGNDEISGVNQLISDWFEQNGYAPLHAKRFKRISLIYFVRR